jgi:cytochrome c oxidase subunit 2
VHVLAIGIASFDPHSSQAVRLVDFSMFIYVVCAVIFLLVIGLVSYAAVRFRGRPGQPDPKPGYGRIKLEIGWTVAPLVLLIVIFVFTFRTARAVDPPAPANPDLVIVAHQWWWEVRYPQAGFTTANEIHIPVGKDLAFRIESADVIHDFWVPQLARKMDAIPGHPSNIWINADQVGTYLGACSEFCGAEHGWMRFRVIVSSQADYDTWQKHQATPAAEPSTGLPAQGFKLFKEATCIRCHAVKGTDAKGDVGPDLTHVASRERIAAELLTNTPDNLSRWLINPQALKPDCHMPNEQFSRDEVNAVVAYLEELQ